jgi:hypothetical protein
MTEACPMDRPGSRGASLRYRRNADRADVPEAQASSQASTRLLFGDPSSPEFSHLTGARQAIAMTLTKAAQVEGPILPVRSSAQCYERA